MDYIRTEADGQLAFTQSSDFLLIPSCLYGFHNTETTVETAESGRIVYCHRGPLIFPKMSGFVAAADGCISTRTLTSTSVISALAET